MIRFLKEVYLTGFTIVFKSSRAKKVSYRAGSAIGAVALIEALGLIGISGFIQIYLNRRYVLPKPLVLIALSALFLANHYVLYFLGHGIKFAGEFDGFKKSRRIFLQVSVALTVVVVIVVFTYSAIAYRHFFGIR